MRALLLVLILVPQLAMAKVYMCRDAATGKTTFTDRACDTAAATREEVRVPATNVDSGSRTAEPAERGAWLSDRDTRKTGREFNAIARRDMQEESGAGIVPDAAVEEGS